MQEEKSRELKERLDRVLGKANGGPRPVFVIDHKYSETDTTPQVTMGVYFVHNDKVLLISRAPWSDSEETTIPWENVSRIRCIDNFELVKVAHKLTEVLLKKVSGAEVTDQSLGSFFIGFLGDVGTDISKEGG